MSPNLIPYTRHQITPEDEAAVLRVLRSPHLTRGPETLRLEADLCRQAGAAHAIAVASGTMALELTYAATGDAQMSVPTLTFLATANAAVRVGRQVEFRESEPTTGLSPAACPSRAAVFVTLGGQPAPADWPGIVDAAHGPIRHGPMSVATILSFHPAKHVTCGEGGAILTDDDDLAGQLRELRDSGRKASWGYRLGTNGHLSELSAALARSQLARYDEGVTRRRAIAAQYDAAFANLTRIRPVPHHPDSARHLYQVLTPLGERDAIKQRLADHGIVAQVHYRPVHLEPYWVAQQHAPSLPGAEWYARCTLSLPLFPSLTADEIDRVIQAVQACDHD